MTDIIGRAILFDLAGGYLTNPLSDVKSPSIPGVTPALDRSKLQEIISELINDKILEDVQNSVKNQLVGQVKREITTDLTTEMKNSFSLSINSISNTIKELKEGLNEFKSAIKITKNYISFNKRRLVSVSEGRDESDVITKKQLAQEVSKIKN